MLPNNQQKVGVLLVNVGTPNIPSVEAIRDYLKEFLSDPLVVNLPRWLWLCILNLIILKKRPPALVPLYKKIFLTGEEVILPAPCQEGRFFVFI